MTVDQLRVKTILERNHSFYDATAKYRSDDRLRFGTGDFILTQVQPDMHVLDVGCGSGSTLIRGARQFFYGLGVDNDPDHIRMAEDNLKTSGATNVSFRLLDFEADSEALESESFDFVFSQRGPLDNSVAIQTALRVLRPNGVIFIEIIGNRHLHEVTTLFKSPQDTNEIQTVEQLRKTMEENGVDIRIVSDLMSKRFYPDVYDWLQFQCNIWTWLGEALPEADDPRFGVFAEQNTTSTGEIETTHHVAWVGGVKR